MYTQVHAESAEVEGICYESIVEDIFYGITNTLAFFVISLKAKLKNNNLPVKTWEIFYQITAI